MDFCWLIMLLASMGCLASLNLNQASEWYRLHAKVFCSVAAFAAFRVFDLFVNAAAYAPFGPTGWGGRYRNRDEHCRVILLTVMNFAELIFWYSILFTYLGWFGGGKFIYPGGGMPDKLPFTSQHALLLAMSTITTVGYGTVAPDDMTTTIVAGFLSVSGLLLIGVGVASTVSLAISPPQQSTCGAIGGEWPKRNRHGHGRFGSFRPCYAALPFFWIAMAVLCRRRYQLRSQHTT